MAPPLHLVALRVACGLSHRVKVVCSGPWVCVCVAEAATFFALRVCIYVFCPLFFSKEAPLLYPSRRVQNIEEQIALAGLLVPRACCRTRCRWCVVVHGCVCVAGAAASCTLRMCISPSTPLFFRCGCEYWCCAHQRRRCACDDSLLLAHGCCCGGSAQAHY